MRKILWLIIVFLIVGIGYLIWRIEVSRLNTETQISNDTNPVDLFKETESINGTESDSDQSKKKDSIYFPISRYVERISLRSFGKDVKLQDQQELECGQAYSGFHTADDLEVSPQELGEEVAVYAMANGIIKQARNADGYGGLMVIEHKVNGSSLIGIYGHLDNASFTKKSN